MTSLPTFGLALGTAGPRIEMELAQQARRSFKLRDAIDPKLKDPDGYWFTIHSGTLGLFVNKAALGGKPPVVMVQGDPMLAEPIRPDASGVLRVPAMPGIGIQLDDVAIRVGDDARRRCGGNQMQSLRTHTA